MRKQDITDELIALSKKAKELGFPQDVEVGDWLHVIDHYIGPQSILLENNLFKDGDFICSLSDNRLFEDWHLILSFDICCKFLGEDINKMTEEKARQVIEKLQK